MNINWKLKSYAFRIMSHMPNRTLYLIQRYVTRRSKVNITEIYPGWLYHLDSIKKSNATTLIEFGAGKTLAQNLFLSNQLESQTVVDLYPMLELPMVNIAIKQLKSLGVDLDGRSVSSLEDLEKFYGIRYLAPFDMRNTDFAPHSFDICASTNTLEHIPVNDIKAIFREVHRLLRPGGIVSAMIDYSDHYAHSDRNLTRLNYLQFSEKEWAAYNHSNHYQNRMRNNHFKKIFGDIGFRTLSNTTKWLVDHTDMDLCSELLTGDPSDYYTTGFWRLERP